MVLSNRPQYTAVTRLLLYEATANIMLWINKTTVVLLDHFLKCLQHNIILSIVKYYT